MDYSPLVVHFTKDSEMVRAKLIKEGAPLHAFKKATGIERLLNILTTRRILASPMPFLPGDPTAVCFTECVWESLTEIAEAQYSPYGVVFEKKKVFEAGGGPALYLRGDLLKEGGEGIPPKMLPFVVPFDPTAVLKSGVIQDWLHEREWRLPSDFQFEYSDIRYVIVKTLDDARAIVHKIGSQSLPEEKLIPTDVHTAISTAWKGGYHG